MIFQKMDCIVKSCSRLNSRLVLKVTWKAVIFLNFWLVMYKYLFILTKDHHHHEPYSSLFYMLARMYAMVKDFSFTLLYITMHFFWVISWTLNYTLKTEWTYRISSKCFIMEIPGSWFLISKHVKNTCGRVMTCVFT